MLSCICASTASDLVILDEPSVGMDDDKLAWLSGFINDLIDNNKSVLIATHDERLSSLAHRALILSGGLIQYESETCLNAFERLRSIAAA